MNATANPVLQRVEEMVKDLENLKAELEAKNSEMQEFIQIISHDLRSPLVNVQGFTKDLESYFKELSSNLENIEFPDEIKEKVALLLHEDIPESLHYIQSSVKKMDSRIKGVLYISRLCNVNLNIEDLDMNELVSETIDGFSFQIKGNKLSLTVDNLPPCKGDWNQACQLFSNLLDNALKSFSPDRAGVIKISGYMENDNAVYCVQDNGVGIPPEHQERIFQIFQRIHLKRDMGEGLGLTAVRMIVDRHHGNIWLESEPGKGSTFYVSLPGVTPKDTEVVER